MIEIATTAVDKNINIRLDPVFKRPLVAEHAPISAIISLLL